MAGAKVLGGDAAKAKKVAELSGDVAVLEQSVVAARARYDTMKEINLEVGCCTMRRHHNVQQC